MGRNPLIVAALTVVLTACAGPGRGITGNDTGGIIPYSPAVEGTYRRLAADHCGWHRLSHVITACIVDTAITSASSAWIVRAWPTDLRFQLQRAFTLPDCSRGEREARDVVVAVPGESYMPRRRAAP